MQQKVLVSPYTAACFFIIGCLLEVFNDLFLNDSHYSGYIGVVLMFVIGLVIISCGLSFRFKKTWVKIIPLLVFFLLATIFLYVSFVPKELYKLRWVAILLCGTAFWAIISFAVAIFRQDK